MAYKRYGDFNITEGAVLVEDVVDKEQYNVLYVEPLYYSDDEDKEFVLIGGILEYDEVDSYINKDFLGYVGLENIEDYESVYEKIYDIMSYKGLDIFYDPNPFISYKLLLEKLKSIEIKGEEGIDYSLEKN